jgi:uncharacterized membrane protein SpoIIM required for sporulation
MIWLHNLRAIALATLMGLFSFGVLGALVIMLPLFIIGFFARAVFTGSGFSPWLFMAGFILPHGLLEIPALIVAGPPSFACGSLAASNGKTIGGQGWIALAIGRSRADRGDAAVAWRAVLAYSSLHAWRY